MQVGPFSFHDEGDRDHDNRRHGNDGQHDARWSRLERPLQATDPNVCPARLFDSTQNQTPRHFRREAAITSSRGARA
jgi:hypothetical protein